MSRVALRSKEDEQVCSARMGGWVSRWWSQAVRKRKRPMTFASRLLPGSSVVSSEVNWCFTFTVERTDWAAAVTALWKLATSRAAGWVSGRQQGRCGVNGSKPHRINYVGLYPGRPQSRGS